MKVVSSGYSFNDISDTPGTQVSLERFKGIEVHHESEALTIGAGVSYTELIEALRHEQLALPNLPSLPHLNVVSSVVTGAHGGGIHTQTMASSVTALRLVDPNGDIKVLTRDDKEFSRYLHSFGALGIITELTI